MAVEIERKFLVRGDGWRAQIRTSEPVRQGYLSRKPVVRVRRIGARAALTVKGEGLIARTEYEYEIPVEDAEAMLAELCVGLIDKTRHAVVHGGRLWQIDEFRGRHSGLVLAEVELARADEAIEIPAWAGDEVTDDPHYQNANLSRQDR